jgi:hypothetical protein
MRRCIFSGHDVLTKEDIWPQWMIKLLKKHPDEIVPMKAKRHTDPLRKWFKIGNRALEFKGVCQNCNNGWMSVLEDDTSPILTPMITNESVRLDSAQRLQLTQWTMKCAMLFEFIDGEGRFYTQDDRSQFHETLVPVGDFVEIWLAHYSGTIFRAATDHRGVQLKGLSGRPYLGHIMTMVFGHLVIQILNIKCLAANDMTAGIKVKTEGEWADFIVNIDPAIPFVQWPPKLSLDDSRLNAFSRRFIVSSALSPSLGAS